MHDLQKQLDNLQKALDETRKQLETQSAPSTQSVTKEKLFVQILLDRTGSMADRWSEAVNSVNKYVNELEDLETQVRLTVFDSEGIDTLRDAKKSEYTDLSVRECPPRYMTNLYDAIGRTVGDVEKRVDSDHRVAFIILTDGYENASKEFNKYKVKDLLTKKQEEDKWLVVFLGADIDAMTSGAQIGTRSQSTVNVNKAKLGETMSLMSHKTQLYSRAPSRQEGIAVADWCESDRSRVS